MKTYLIDTNFLLRFLLKDNPIQYAETEKLFSSAQKRKSCILVTPATMHEVVYVLIGFYKVNRAETSELLQKFLHTDIAEIKDKEVLTTALEVFTMTKLDFHDLYLCAYAHLHKLTLSTFDKELINLQKTQKLIS